LSHITIRALAPSEWQIFRQFRLNALRASPGVFAMSYEESTLLTPEQWQATIKGATHQVFGLFDSADLIGITAAFGDRDDPTGQTALLAMSFILPPYRGRGFSRMFYDARLAWIRQQPQFRRVIVSHRETNEVSRRANQRYGFVPTHKMSHKWPDEITEDELFYELDVST
jgi:RimJ/RimL family protein N-acetyltransferase